MKKILVCIDMSEDYKKILIDNCKNCVIDFILKKDINKDVLKKYDAIVGNVSFEHIKDLDNIEWLQTESAGVDIYKNLNENIMISNCSGAYSESIAEYLLGVIYMTYKKLDLYLKNQKYHTFENLGKVKQVKGSKVLVVGFGDIGETFAKKASLLDMEIYGVRNNKNNKPDYVKEMYSLFEMENILDKMDIVVCCLPSTDKTKGLFDYNLLKKINKNALFMNVGRGDLIKINDLMKVLDEDYFYRVYLDVMEVEPLPINSKLWNYDNVIITPHISGNYNMDASYEKMFEIVLNNINKYVNNEKVDNLVDRKLQY